MATDTPSGRSDSIAECVYGSFTGDGTATTVTLGFNPSHIIVFNETDAMRWEKFGDMVAANSIKTVTAGTTTTDTTSAISVSGGVMTLSAALAASGKAIKWIARR